MLMYYLYKLYYLLLVKSDEVIPDLDFDLPDYHDTFQEVFANIGYFIDLEAITQLFVIFVGYNLIRLAVSFRHIRS